MSKSALVKVGLPSEQAESMKRVRQIRQVIEQHDAALARLSAAMEERIRDILTSGHDEAHPDTQTDQPAAPVN